MHRANHLVLAMACRALNWRGRYLNSADRNVKVKPGLLAKWVEFTFN